MSFNWIEWTESKWRNLSMDKLKVDEAYLNLNSEIDKLSFLYSLSEECYKCPYSLVTKLSSNEPNIIKIDSSHLLSLKLFSKHHGKYVFDNETAICSFIDYDFGEFGVYNLSLFENSTCQLIVDKEPVNIYYPMLLILLVFLGLIVSWQIVKKIWTYFSFNERAEEEETSFNGSDSRLNNRKRLDSLDVLRGISIVLMIFVNSNGGYYYWIEHASWNGLHLADIVFPSFLWIMGVCIPISVSSQLRKGSPKRKLYKAIFVRSVKLFAIGLCLNSVHGATTFDKLRIMGVLQRFGIAYFVCGTIHTIFSHADIPIITQNNFKRHFKDICRIKWEILISILLVIVNLSVIFGLKIPDCPLGYLGPGGKHDYVQHKKCIGGAIGYLDEHILGNNHIYQNPTARKIYDSSAFDPEGIFGCILTVVQVFLGLQTGVMLMNYSTWKDRSIRLILWATGLGLIGLGLCQFSVEDGIIPINKNLWSLTFVLVTSALDNFLLLVLLFIVDVRKIWSGFPFKESGKNSIIMYVGHSVMHMLPWHWTIGLMNTHFVLLLQALWNTTMWIWIAVYLDGINYYYNL